MAAPNYIKPEAQHLVPYAADPLSLIGENVNWLYQYHSPAVVNIALVGAEGGSREWVFALPASGDALVYRMEVHVVTDVAATVTAALYCQTGASTGAWGSVVIQEAKSVTGGDWLNSVLTVGTVPAGTTHGKLTVVASTGNVQAHCVILYPDAPVGLPTTVEPSGFIPYTSAVLESVTGAPIQREMVNRIYESTRAILRDRKQAVFGYADLSTAAQHRFSSSAYSSHLVGIAGAHLPGQRGATLTVRYRITDTTGTGSVVKFMEDGGDSIALTVDDTDRTATMKLVSDQPEFRIVATPDSALEIKYIQADWTPGD